MRLKDEDEVELWRLMVGTGFIIAKNFLTENAVKLGQILLNRFDDEKKGNPKSVEKILDDSYYREICGEIYEGE
jgi:hypothetical protein|tara:strand:- start:1439 stop:1660 length:222 start_codon:yes stop_codon:yes gene_type:complete